MAFAFSPDSQSQKPLAVAWHTPPGAETKVIITCGVSELSYMTPILMNPPQWPLKDFVKEENCISLQVLTGSQSRLSC